MDLTTGTNAKRLLWAGFFSIFAAGVGFSVRAGILPDWAAAYGFTNTELGGITGGGLIGFGAVIILGSLIADHIGYGVLMTLAFVLHFLSAAMVLFADPVYQNFGQGAVYWSLFFSMIMFSVANGLCEVVVNPMTATLFPTQKTHYLNILHAGWPGGLIAGGLIALLMNEPKLGTWEPGWKVHWMIQMSLFLVPVLIYGGLLLGQRLPRSEASEAGVSLGTMLLEFAAPVFFLLLIIHAMVGYVELGTDSWIGTITGTILGEGALGRLFFVYTSALMFTLRFFAGPIEHRLSPLGLLFLCAILASIGLVLLGSVSGLWMCLVAVTVYGFGKTFFWPTMLAVVSERFPRGGAVTLGTIGGIGMLSAGFLGGPGIGFKQDRFASTELKQQAPETYARYAAAQPNHFLVFETQGLDGNKKAVLQIASKTPEDAEAKRLQERELSKAIEQGNLAGWWPVAREHIAEDKKPIEQATLFGGQMALLWTAMVPAAMAVLYLVLIVYFRLQGGYRRVELGAAPALGTGDGPWQFSDRVRTADPSGRPDERIQSK
jgi:MFS family permease